MTIAMGRELIAEKPFDSRNNNSEGKEVHMSQINVKLADGQTENVEIAGVTVTQTETPREVDDDALAALEADERVSVERVSDPAAAD